MTPALVLYLSVAGWCQVNPPPDRPIPRFDSFAETAHRDVLKATRRGIAMFEWMIEWQEQNLAASNYTPETIRRIRGEIEEWRRDVAKMKKVERELVLWEQQRKTNPGTETDRVGLERFGKLLDELWPPPSIAPPPREKK